MGSKTGDFGPAMGVSTLIFLFCGFKTEDSDRPGGVSVWGVARHGLGVFGWVFLALGGVEAHFACFKKPHAEKLENNEFENKKLSVPWHPNPSLFFPVKIRN